MTTPKKETAQEKFQRLREKNKEDMRQKMERIQTQQKAVALNKSPQKRKEMKATAEGTGETVKNPEEKLTLTPERKVQIDEKSRLAAPNEFKPLASRSQFQSPRLRNVNVSDSELSNERVLKMHQSYQRCTNCCGGLPGRGPGSGRFGGGGCCVQANMDSDYENCQEERLRGGADNGKSTCEISQERFRGGCGGGGCSQPPKPCFPPSCGYTPQNQSCPPPCWRSHRWQATCQKHEPRQMEIRGTKTNCPCGSCGPGCHENPGRGGDGGCCSQGQSKGPPCKCKCQSCKSFQPQGGCGGQSCGKMYSCSGSGGGSSCFPRNYRRREGSQCCGGTSPQHRSGCC